MFVRLTACIAVVLISPAVARAQAPRVLTLEVAFARTLERHPELARFSHLREAAQASREAESQGAPLRLELELENAPRSRQDSAFDSAETTLSLASVVELGDKRGARVALADAQISALAMQELARRADLLAEVARRYLDFVATQSLTELAITDVAQREKAVEAAAQRVRAGATPESVRLSAEAALVRASLHRDRLRAQSRAEARRLAILWGEREPGFDRASGDPLSVPAVEPLETLRELLAQSPELRRYADESRLREARLQLARSSRAMDLEWRVGIRRLEEDGSWAGVAGLSLPLGSASRAEPRIRAAHSELASLALEREAEEWTLEATLVEAHLRLSNSAAEVAAMRGQLLPKFEQAERAAERAFRAGALTYTEWAQLQSEAMSARAEQIAAGVEAHRALIEIQRLTGSPFISIGAQP
jgi:cobalt-zinc-cadmium efflux system outer membrane protein